jgi:soluble lytic murein transglycosylase-like protein
VPAALIHAIISVESRFNPNARSRKGAMGLMQLMPATAAMVGVDDAFDPHQNVLGGARYLGLLIRQFEGNLRLAVAAYNAGPAAVLRRGAMQTFPETRRYVRRVLSRYHLVRRLYEQTEGVER